MDIDIYGIPHFSWDWWIDPEGPAYEVLDEFRNFGPPSHDLVGNAQDKSRRPVDNFPFVHRDIHNTN
jgi:hypothetical protein